MDVAQRGFGWEDLANLNSHVGGGNTMKGNEKRGSLSVVYGPTIPPDSWFGVRKRTPLLRVISMCTVFILHSFIRKSNYFMSKAVVLNINMVRNQTSSPLSLHPDSKACFTLHPHQQLINNCPRGAVSNGELMTAEWKGTSRNLISFIDYRVLKGHLGVLITAASR